MKTMKIDKLIPYEEQDKPEIDLPIVSKANES